MSDPGADEPVPKLPRGRMLKFSGPEMFRILMTLVTLIGVIVLAKPCANSVSNFVMGYPQGSGASKNTMPTPGTVEPPADDNAQQYERLRPGMTDEEIKAAIERSKARNAAGQGSAPAPAPNTATIRGNAVSPPPAGSVSPPPAPNPSTSTPPPPKANTTPSTSTPPPPKANTTPSTSTPPPPKANTAPSTNVPPPPPKANTAPSTSTQPPPKANTAPSTNVAPNPNSPPTHAPDESE